VHAQRGRLLVRGGHKKGRKNKGLGLRHEKRDGPLA